MFQWADRGSGEGIIMYWENRSSLFSFRRWPTPWKWPEWKNRLHLKIPFEYLKTNVYLWYFYVHNYGYYQTGGFGNLSIFRYFASVRGLLLKSSWIWSCYEEDWRWWYLTDSVLSSNHPNYYSLPPPAITTCHRVICHISQHYILLLLKPIKDIIINWKIDILFI